MTVTEIEEREAHMMPLDWHAGADGVPVVLSEPLEHLPGEAVHLESE